MEEGVDAIEALAVLLYREIDLRTGGLIKESSTLCGHSEIATE